MQRFDMELTRAFCSELSHKTPLIYSHNYNCIKLSQSSIKSCCCCSKTDNVKGLEAEFSAQLSRSLYDAKFYGILTSDR